MSESDPPRPAALDDERALPILTAEYYGLSASRSLAYNEAFARASMFLTFLSASLIVIGFLIGSQGLVGDVLAIVLLLLVADLYIGLATLGRLIGASGEELHCVRGMNRIRHAFDEMVPGLERYFVTSAYDDVDAILLTYAGLPPGRGMLRNVVHGATTAVAMVATIDVFLVVAVVVLVAVGLGVSPLPAVLLGLIVFVATFALVAWVALNNLVAQQTAHEPRFPTPRG